MLDDTRPSHALMQDPAFAKALRACGQSPVHLSGGLMVLQQRFGGLRVCMLPRAAPPIDLPVLLRDVGLHRTPLILSPDQPCALPRSLRIRPPTSLAIIDLTHPTDHLRARLHQKWRNQLKRGEKAGLRVSHHRLRPDANDPILQTAEQQARQRKYAQWPPALTAAFAKVAPTQTHVFHAMLREQDLGHMVFLSHGDQVTYHLGYISDQGKAVCAHNVLMWCAMVYFARMRFMQLDLGIISGQVPGLDRFKCRTGAAVHPTGGTYLYWRPWAKS